MNIIGLCRRLKSSQVLGSLSKAGLRTSSADLSKRQVVLVEGVRTPFVKSNSLLEDVPAHYILGSILRTLIHETKINPDEIDSVIVGSVVLFAHLSNIGLKGLAFTGLNTSIPTETVTMACISSNLSITNAIASILSGRSDAVIAAGVEYLSDVPICPTKRYREVAYKKQRLGKSEKAPSYFKYEVPAIAEFTSGETMGHYADRMAAAFKVSREEQDEYGLRSHELAQKARDEGKLIDVKPLYKPDCKKVELDNTIRVAPMSKIATMKPAFNKTMGTITAATASPVTDGASASLIMSEEKALKLGLKPKAYLKDYVYVAQDPVDQLLLGPAYSISKLLQLTRSTVSDYDVYEIHEAFAAQVLANLKALDSDTFSRVSLNRSSKVGMPDMNRINAWGGSLSLGHPFGATGVRLVTAAANRLISENKSKAMVASCAAGGLGHAIILERYPGS